MATRTFLGGDMNVASNWAENAVPVAGDDVVIPASAGSGYLSADLPSSGLLRSFIVDNNYTGTINIDTYTISIGSTNLLGDIFVCGNNANWQCTSGKIYLYSTINAANYNRISSNATSMQNVNLHLDSDGINRVFTINGTLFNCKSLILGQPNAVKTFTIGQTNGLIINIYGDFIYHINNTNYTTQITIGAISGTINFLGNNNIYNYPFVLITNAATININGNYTLNSPMFFQLNVNGSQTFNIASNAINTNNKPFVLYGFIGNNTHLKFLNFNNNTFDYFYFLGNNSSVPINNWALASGFNVEKELLIIPDIHQFNFVGIYTSGFKSIVGGEKK